MKPHLFTSNFKTYTKRILAFLLALIIFYAAAQVTAIAFAKQYDDRNGTQKITSYQIEDFYALPENSIDVLILGSSHAMCSYDPAWIESEFNLKTFNLGTALQQPDTAYFLLCEALKTQKPKYLIYDVYFKVMEEEHSKEQVTTVLKELKFSGNAISLFWNNLKLDDKLDFYNNYLNPFGRLESIMESSEKYSDARNPAYKGMGFYSTPNVVSDELLSPEKHPFAKEHKEFNSRQVEYLKKLISLAKENGIEVILTTAPLPPTILSRIDYFDEICAEIGAVATEHSVPFVNFTTSSAEVLEDVDFADQGHLNQNGCAKFMEHFTTVMKELW